MYRPDDSFMNPVSIIISTSFLLPPATKLGQGYLFTGVCDSVHRGGGGSASVHAGITPPDQTPPRARHPPNQTPSRSDTPREQICPSAEHADTVSARAVRILLECNLAEFTFCVTVQNKRSDSILFSSPALN